MTLKVDSFEPHDFFHSYIIYKLKLMGTDNTMVITTGKGWRVVKGKGNQIYGDG